MKILVTGANGQVGQALQAMAVVIACGRQELDVTRLDSIEQSITRHRPELIINSAADQVAHPDRP